MASKWKELGRVGKCFSQLKRLISSGLRIPFDDMVESTQYSSDPAFWDKGIEIIVLREMQDRSTQATREFDVCYVFNLKIWLRTSIVL